MAKVGELTVGILTKPMIQVGWVVVTEQGDLYSYETFPSLERAKKKAEHPVWNLEVKPVYIERVPES